MTGWEELKRKRWFAIVGNIACYLFLILFVVVILAAHNLDVAQTRLRDMQRYLEARLQIAQLTADDDASLEEVLTGILPPFAGLFQDSLDARPNSVAMLFDEDELLAYERRGRNERAHQRLEQNIHLAVAEILAEARTPSTVIVHRWQMPHIPRWSNDWTVVFRVTDDLMIVAATSVLAYDVLSSMTPVVLAFITIIGVAMSTKRHRAKKIIEPEESHDPNH